ncbi:MAG: ribosome silencing factor [Ignavibacteria bacterium]|nr:ribosome silencing factor [Ignavibacteria bacterium]
MESREFADKITELIFNKKGYDVLIMDLRNLTSFTDYFIICSADSEVQVKAVADEIDKDFRDKGIKCWHREGYLGLTWVLLDYVDVVVHIFKKDAREFYSLEKLWGDAPTDKIQDIISEQSTKAD